MDRLIVPSVKPLSVRCGHTVRAVLDDETYTSIVKMAEESGISITQLMGIYAKFGCERAVIGDGIVVESDDKE